jgi:hypothetical protein
MIAKIVSAGRWSVTAAHRRQQQRVLYSEEAGGTKRLAGDERLDVGGHHGNEEDQEHAGGSTWEIEVKRCSEKTRGRCNARLNMNTRIYCMC